MDHVINKYKRLPGRYWTLFTSHSLWLGPDHILAVYSNLFSQTYKRFYYQDIQRITVRKTKTHLIRNGIWAGLAFISAQFLWGGWTPIPIVFSGFFLLGLLLDGLRGPNCWCHIQTAVQTEKLPALHRWRTALKTINRIRPEIERVQGPMPVDVLEQNK
ncbi:MAG: hypothetical protein EHM45_21000 [Desulfobacteraceae bacterium]|nr:MAG: hypothetical protein EHM45_21000 [Desulfobacteraceae bacterium]